MSRVRKQLTFWEGTVDTVFDPQVSVTVRFMTDGILLKLSRDTSKSVIPIWTFAGDWTPGAEGMRKVRLAPSLPEAERRLLASRLTNLGWSVINGAIVMGRRTYSVESNSITCAVRLATHHVRRRSLDLGIPAKGRAMATLSVEEMRVRILARAR